jgi:hypothetical protein
MSADGKALPDRNVGSHKRVLQLYSKLTDFLDQPRPGLRDPEAHKWATTLYRQLVELHETVSRTKRTVDERETLTKLALAHPRASRKLERVRRDQERNLCDLRAIVNASMVYAEANQPPNPRLRTWTRSVLDRMARHEREETALIQELIQTDVGTGD